MFRIIYMRAFVYPVLYVHYCLWGGNLVCSIEFQYIFTSLGGLHKKVLVHIQVFHHTWVYIPSITQSKDEIYTPSNIL